MDKYIEPEKDYRCSGCGIMKDSDWYGDGDDDYCEVCLNR